MPTTLAHIGAHAWLVRGVVRNADFKWIYLGCIIPDLPWIVQRVAWLPILEVERYDLRIYCVVQATLLFCLILSAAFAALSTRIWRTFAALGLGALLHLLVDTLETKWGNGVHLFAPFDWRMLNLGIVWPESLPIHLLSLLGLAYILWHWRAAMLQSWDLRFSTLRLAIAGMLVATYFAAPMLLLGQAEAADNHFVKTLRGHADRTGWYVEMDRVRFQPEPQGTFVINYARERFQVSGLDLDAPAKVSLRGRFAAHEHIAVEAMRVHPGGVRDLPTYLGLGLVLLLWLACFWQHRARWRA